MIVPFFTKQPDRQLTRRKGGGAGRGGGGKSSSGGKGSSSGTSSGGTSGSGVSGGSPAVNGAPAVRGGTPRINPISSGSGSVPTRVAASYGTGGGRISTIPSGQPFSGRTQGGGSRSQVFGTRQYGSGYPGVSGRGVAGRGFPFFFWPVVWGGAAGVGTAAYLHDSEYGQYDNSSRPGGALMSISLSSKSINETFMVLSDNATVTALVEDIVANCSSVLNNTNIQSIPFTDSSFPHPEQALQYYRASSVVLSLDSYNNTGTLAKEGTPDTPLPTPVDTELLDCLNFTIGAAVPLISDNRGLALSAPPTLGVVGLLYLVLALSSWS